MPSRPNQRERRNAVSVPSKVVFQASRRLLLARGKHRGRMGHLQTCWPSLKAELERHPDAHERCQSTSEIWSGTVCWVDLEVAVNVLAAERLSVLALTLLQKQVALFAAQGGLRIDCEERFGVSQEALKKHLRTIYNVTGVANWAGLRDQYWAEV
jgi:hypothetical protein